MDTHDVSEELQYLKYLAQHKRTLQNAQRFRGQRPKQKQSREELIMEFMRRQMANKNMTFDRDEFAIRSSFLPPTYVPSIAPFRELNKVMIKDLVLETHHRGSYLLLRTVTPPDTMTAILAIVEDEEGKVLVLQLYNQDSTRAAEDILDEGAVLIVKEPYLKVMADGGYGIRVDHLSDVKFVPGHDELVAPSWRINQRLTGKFLLGHSVWHTAHNDNSYSKALEYFPAEDEAFIIKLNRALVFLRVGQLDDALRDIPNPKISEKALFRKAQALYRLGRYRESCDVFKILCQEYPGNNAASKEFMRAIARLAEQVNGKYPFKQLQLEAAQLRPPHLDRATYIGPISVRRTNSHGRGLFTTKAVKAGDILLCEKAFAHSFVDHTGFTRSAVVLINPETNRMSLGGQAELITLIVQRIYKNASLVPVITDLHHGSYNSPEICEVDDAPVVDTFLVERIVSLNGFGCPVSSHQSRINLMTNQKVEEKFSSCGLWPMASRINHSCYSNCRRSFIGDMMIIRATQDLEPNTEIVFWYSRPFDKPDKQPDLEHWGFRCSCAICKDIQSTPKSTLVKRDKLVADLRKSFQSSNPNGARIESILVTLAETYSRPASEVPRLTLWDPYLGLCGMYSERNQPKKAIECGLKVLESLGYVIDGGNFPLAPKTPLVVKKWGLMLDLLVDCWMFLARGYSQVAPELEAKAEHYAKLTYRICVGEDETFHETYGRHGDRLNGFLAEGG
ncbi:TPR domain protein [Penicillium riverlandense]|uniref:TPR domain protein n=1 Tax=Penicillium riverlandense TaxID=1903569 RepID=UPI002546C4A4|nr:TPR domain protein [Penicillium riverlandense]KAJ5812101.1 TPR domain protein [Penicillium riverlandense]